MALQIFIKINYLFTKDMYVDYLLIINVLTPVTNKSIKFWQSPSMIIYMNTVIVLSLQYVKNLFSLKLCVNKEIMSFDSCDETAYICHNLNVTQLECVPYGKMFYIKSGKIFQFLLNSEKIVSILPIYLKHNDIFK